MGAELTKTDRARSPQRQLELEGRDLVEKGWYGKKIRTEKKSKAKTKT
jgi:hypothetical protein